MNLKYNHKKKKKKKKNKIKKKNLMYIPAARALRAGRQQAEAPGPALSRPVAIGRRAGR